MEQKSKNWSVFSFAWNLGFSIAVPLVLFALGGRLLDKTLGTSPWFLLGGIFFSIIVSSWVVCKKTADLLK